ncbi:hypothetical protein J2W35_006722 [Variovorax boronicumulans]|uniref:hypothetical protein n=1 Tax=Variovorax boronicumulans TaxID=436515 RepID=UPI00277FE15B|nr:hypothetical protein [Variovorax boronicumulans]MDQ0086340.1 hypothetical protein [Variovorax boronicumulans]
MKKFAVSDVVRGGPCETLDAQESIRSLLAKPVEGKRARSTSISGALAFAARAVRVPLS